MSVVQSPTNVELGKLKSKQVMGPKHALLFVSMFKVNEYDVCGSTLGKHEHWMTSLQTNYGSVTTIRHVIVFVV